MQGFSPDIHFRLHSSCHKIHQVKHDTLLKKSVHIAVHHKLYSGFDIHSHTYKANGIKMKLVQTVMLIPIWDGSYHATFRWLSKKCGCLSNGSKRIEIERNLNVATGRLRHSRSNLRFLRADAKYHVNKLLEEGEDPTEQEQIIASDRQEVATKWSRFIFWVGGLSQQAWKQSQLLSIKKKAKCGEE